MRLIRDAHIHTYQISVTATKPWTLADLPRPARGEVNIIVIGELGFQPDATKVETIIMLGDGVEIIEA